MKTTAMSRRSHLLRLLVLASALGLLVACSTADDTSAEASENDDTETTVDFSDDAPDPVSVDVDELEMIEIWEEARVPTFRDGEALDFEAHSSRIENGGTLLLDADRASSDEVIGFYRGAMEAAAWEITRVSAREITAESDVASIQIIANVYDDQTLIMMILTDRPGSS